MTEIMDRGSGEYGSGLFESGNLQVVESLELESMRNELTKLYAEIKTLRAEINTLKPVEHNTIDIYIKEGILCIGLETEEDKKFEARVFGSSKFRNVILNYYNNVSKGQHWNMYKSETRFPSENSLVLETTETFEDLKKITNITGILSVIGNAGGGNYALDYNETLLDVYDNLHGIQPPEGFVSKATMFIQIAKIRYSLDENVAVPKDKNDFINGTDGQALKIIYDLFEELA